MILSILNWYLLFYMIAPLLLGILVIWGTSYYYNGISEHSMSVEFFKLPTNNTIVILGILVPILIATLSYLITKKPGASYNSLIACILLMFITLIISIWQSFSILRIASTDNIVQLNLPGDLHYISGMGLMYALLIVSLFYLAIFFFVEFKIPIQPQKPTITSGANYYIAKPKITVDQVKDEVQKLWGNPNKDDQTNNIFTYETPKSFIYVHFNTNNKVKQIDEQRR